jgi:hypothetical protein
MCEMLCRVGKILRLLYRGERADKEKTETIKKQNQHRLFFIDPDTKGWGAMDVRLFNISVL